MKSRSRGTVCYNYLIALKFDRHLGSTTAEVPVKFHSDWKSKPESRSFETSRDLAVRRPPAQWIEAQVISCNHNQTHNNKTCLCILYGIYLTSPRVSLFINKTSLHGGVYTNIKIDHIKRLKTEDCRKITTNMTFSIYIFTFMYLCERLSLITNFITMKIDTNSLLNIRVLFICACILCIPLHMASKNAIYETFWCPCHTPPFIEYGMLIWGCEWVEQQI